MRKVLFLDRDGVINKDVHYLYRKEDMHFIDGAPEALKKAVEAGYDLIVVTNQSGVARGYYTEEDVQVLHQYMGDLLAQSGAPILAFYYCPHLKGAKIKAYDKDCSCRKPKPGLLLQAMKDYSIDKKHSFMVGDKPGDVAAAKAAGLRGYQFTGSNLDTFLGPLLEKEKRL